MRLDIKSIIIIFLVSLLGGSLGTYGAIKFSKTGTAQKNGQTSLNVSTVNYANEEKTSYTKAIDKAVNTVVEINCTVKSSSMFFGESESSASGSGVIISEDGYIVTNNHVIDGANPDDIKVSLYSGEVYSAKIIGADSRTDIALLKISAESLPFANFADSNDLKLGEDAIAIGNALGLGISCSNGIVSSLSQEIYINNVYTNVIQTNAEINSGNSGGGLFNINGDLIGIVNAKKSSSGFSQATIEGMGYAIPSNTVLKIVSDLSDYGYVKNRATLGISVSTPSNSGFSYFYYGNSNTIEGVIVRAVSNGGAADEAGIEAGDIITSVNGHPIASYADLSKELDSYNVGETVKVTVNRNEKDITFNVTLQEAVG